MGLIKLFLTMRTSVFAAARLVGDAQVPVRLKVIALVAAIFIISPLNILGDIPLLGIVDDAALLALLLNWFVRAAGPHGSVVPPSATPPPANADLATRG